jgi:hypothetical protein
MVGFMSWRSRVSLQMFCKAISRGVWAALVIAGQLIFLSPSSGQTKSDSPGSSIGGYTGSEACSQCHLGIYKKFSKTSMGRSMSLVTPDLLSSGSYINSELHRKFEVSFKEGKLYQSESGTADDGSASFRDAHEIDWIIGAGMNGFGAIVRKGQYLFQAPLSYYTKSLNWGPSPGYEFIDMGFNRPITPGCIFCHSGRPQSISGSNGQFQSAAFSELAIGCEKCHGPGAAHINAMRGTKSASRRRSPAGDELDTKIVNPARLTPYLADNICMACHQTGDVRILKAGKTYEDIVPGRALDETLSILMIPPTRESPPTADHVEHYYSMTLSKCYRASSGRLSCITCHDPHTEPSRDETPAYFAGKCLACHTNQSCKLSLETRMKGKPANDCIGCHMPKRDIQGISHSSATNHRIVARPDEPFPDITFKQTTSSMPDLVHLNPAPGKRDVPPPLLTLLQAYGELAENKPEYIPSYLKVLGQLEVQQPENSMVQAALGRRDLKSGDFKSAADHLRRALDIHPPVATTYSDLADALSHVGQTDEALPLIEKAIQLDPYNPVPRKMLVVQLIAVKEFKKAHDALQQYIEIFPQDDFMRKMLDRADGKSVK